MKRNSKYIIYLIVVLLLGIGVVYAETTIKEDTLCSLCYEASNQIRLVGYLIMTFKIVVPIILIGLSSIDIFKVVTSGKDDEMPKATKTAIRRAIASVIIFFVPFIFNFVLSMVNETVNDDGTATEYAVCAACLFKPGDSECEQVLNAAKNKTCEVKFSTEVREKE